MTCNSHDENSSRSSNGPDSRRPVRVRTEGGHPLRPRTEHRDTVPSQMRNGVVYDRDRGLCPATSDLERVPPNLSQRKSVTPNFER
ncbi:hypothetical protein GCM10010303_10190 [Streptomyces purpurascens]|nr:hypothetical protein GCM10010303_10190 [Streptomyces purpurascens]